MTTSNNEDVPASIAGFYYQALLACKELSELVIEGANDTVQVGIERGADVKVRINQNEEYSIEAKFYGSNFTKNSDAITHTIYNFYKNSFDDNRLIFATNAAINDDDVIFSRNWNLIEEENIQPYIRYIKFCLIKESLKDKEINNRYKDYKEQNNLSPNSHKSTCIPVILDDPNEEITDYINLELRSDEELQTFLRKFEFRSEEEGEPLKQFTIEELKGVIRQNIQSCIEGENDVDNIFNKLIDSFFETTVELTHGDRLIYNFKESFDYVTVGRFNEICENIANERIRFIRNEGFNSFLETIDTEERTFIGRITTLIRRNPNEENHLNEIKANYYQLRKNLLQEINLNSHRTHLRQFSVTKTHESDFAIIKLLHYLSTLVMCEQVDVADLKAIFNRFSNIEFDEKQYLYKFSNYDDIEDYLNAFIAGNIESKYSEREIHNTPIIIHCSGGKACDQQPLLDITTDIANMGGTKNDLLYYANCNYKCKHCLILNNYLTDKDGFINCPGIKIELDE
ncbi:hypothetical protein EMN47_17015 [Prolixibacteraceae bacterium JC049]|nr:hypothetical protein [Prolixibacteraceae bacterium JC049]